MHSTVPTAAWLFAHDWDLRALTRLGAARPVRFVRAGFDLFSFPGNLALARFDLEAFADRLAARGRRAGWRAVLSHHEHFGALAAAMVAERLGLPGASPESIVAAQHKLHTRRVLQQIALAASLPFQDVAMSPTEALPPDLRFPAFAKPVKGVFSVLARRVDNAAELQRHLALSRAERWLAHRLLEPFERVRRARLPAAGSTHRMLLEQPVPLAVPQFNLDGWVQDGRVHALGVVDAVTVPGTQAFLRWEVPSRLPPAVQARALALAQRLLAALGYRHGCFNLEFFYDAAADRLTAIELNPRLASQFGDLYRRVRGVDPHAIALALALGEDPLQLPPAEPTAQVAASLVYRAFTPAAVPRAPDRRRRAALHAAFADAELHCFTRQGRALARDLRWTGSHRYGVLHLGARDWGELRQRAERASALLGWPAPYADAAPATAPCGWPAAVAATT